MYEMKEGEEDRKDDERWKMQSWKVGRMGRWEDAFAFLFSSFPALQGSLYTKKLVQTAAFKQTLLHTNPFTLRHHYTQTLWHTTAFTRRPCYTRTLLHTDSCTHTDAFTHRPCHSQTLLHTDSCAHRKVYTQTPLHTYSFTHPHFHTQSLIIRGISHEICHCSSVPWCYKKHTLSHCFMVFPMKFATAAQYHDATNITRYLIFSWYFPWNSPNQLSTMMPQRTRVI